MNKKLDKLYNSGNIDKIDLANKIVNEALDKLYALERKEKNTKD